MKTLSLLLLSVAAFAQAPPACLSGPVTQGSVTITCSMMDFTQPNHASDQSIVFVAASGYVLQVRASSSDPAVIGFRIGVTTGPKGSQAISWGVTGESSPPGNADPAAVPAAVPAPLVFRYTFYVGTPTVAAIQVQEMKTGSTQTF